MSALARQVFDPCEATRLDDCGGDRQPARAAKDECAEFGDAMDRNPAEEIDEQPAIVMQRDESAEEQSLVEEQGQGRRAPGDAECEAEDRHRRVVAEERIGEDDERSDESLPWREDFAVA